MPTNNSHLSQTTIDECEKEIVATVVELSKIKDLLSSLRDRLDKALVWPVTKQEDSFYYPICDALANIESQLFYYRELVAKRSPADLGFEEDDDDYLL